MSTIVRKHITGGRTKKLSYNQTEDSQPTAHIGVGGNRVKHYSDGTIFLKDKTNFQIELYNPLSLRALAKISLNGKEISSTGIIVEPGQRVWLDRFIDDKRKFQFDTYLFENTKAGKKATERNGSMRVEFYLEEDNSPIHTPFFGGCGFHAYTSPGVNTRDVDYSQRIGNTSDDFMLGHSSTPTSTLNIDVNDAASFTLCSADGAVTSNANYVSSNNVNSADFLVHGGSCLDDAPIKKVKSKKRAALKETGRVNKGEHSGQNLVTVEGNFNSWMSYWSEWKILPESQKHAVRHEDVRTYCACGLRHRKNWAFCPKCGVEV